MWFTWVLSSLLSVCVRNSIEPSGHYCEVNANNVINVRVLGHPVMFYVIIMIRLTTWLPTKQSGNFTTNANSKWLPMAVM